MRWVEWLAQVQKIVLNWRGMQQLSTGNGEAGELYWTSWIDPGRATGFGAAVYLVPPAAEVWEGGENGRVVNKVSNLGSLIRVWTKSARNLGLKNVPEDLLGTYDATGAIVLSYWAEDFYARSAEEEPAMVRRIMGRVRGLGGVWYGSDEWDTYDLVDGTGELIAKRSNGDESGLGAAGIGSESFTVLRLDSSQEYVSPLRIIAAYRYALEDEFGVRLDLTAPGDAKTEFGSAQFKRLGIWVSGPDHVRDALSHVLFGIRKSFRK